MTAVDKSARDKANPAGEARAAKLIAWFNAGAGGKIIWGKPGSFDACVRVAGKHMTKDNAEGFCANRYHDVTGTWPGRRKGKVAKAGRLALLRRLLSSHPATKVPCPSCGEETSAFAGACPSCGAGIGVAVAKHGDKGEAGYPHGKGGKLAGHAKRIAKLTPLTEQGPNYSRGVKELLADVRLFTSRKDDDAAEHYLLLAEQEAGFIDWDELEERDPFRRATQKAIDGTRTFNERSELIGRALKLAYADDEDSTSYVWVQDLTDDWAVFELSGKTEDAGLYRVRYLMGENSDEVAFGDPEPVERRTEYVPKSIDSAPVMKAVAGPVIKADESRRYTLMPLYPASPDAPTAAHLDAHGDFATADDVQAAVWDYVRKGDRTIRDQHRDGTAIGECVELMCWPHEVTVPLTKADGTTVEKTFGAGTAFMGVVWNDTGWEDVKKGRKTGLSLGGVATRVAVEMNG